MRAASRALGAAAALVAACAIAAPPAPAQGTSPITLDVDARVTPDRAGTPKRPQGVELDIVARIGVPDAFDPPLVQDVEVWFPRAGVYNGGAFPSCGETTLARGGVQACPKGSIMGHGDGDAMADDVPTHPQITVVNGGARNVYFYTVMNNPARVQAPVPGTVTKLARGPYGYRLHATIPRVLQIVAGIPIVLRELRITAGEGTWIATTSCPKSRRWPYRVQVTFDDGQTIDYQSSVACRR